MSRAPTTEAEMICTAEVRELLGGVSRQWVDELVQAGRLTVAGWGPRGRLFDRAQAERVRQEIKSRARKPGPKPKR